MLELEKINEILLNYETLPGVSQIVDKGYYQERYQGESAYKITIKNLSSILGEDSKIFLKVTEETNSYGEDERVVGLKFVESKIKNVEVYE